MLVFWHLGWVDFYFHLPGVAWAARVMAVWAEQVGRLLELLIPSQHNQLPDHQHHPVQMMLNEGQDPFGIREIRIAMHEFAVPITQKHLSLLDN